MANGQHTFKFKGKTYGKESIFLASEARSETYMAFGRENSFLNRLVKEGFIVQEDYAFHPDYWRPIPKEKRRDGYHTHYHVSATTGKVFLGKAQLINGRR